MNNSNNFLARLREKTVQFMYGRYGGDQLSRATSIAAIVVLVLGWIVSSISGSVTVNNIFLLLTLVLLVVSAVRILSRDLNKRAAENQKYLKMTEKLRTWMNLQKRRWKERKTHAFRECPNCKKTLRIKRVKGVHTAHCPLCGHSFTVKF